MGFDPVFDYPLGTRRPDLVTTPSGLGLGELTLDNFARAKLIVRTTLLHARETAAAQPGAAPVELELVGEWPSITHV